MVSRNWDGIRDLNNDAPRSVQTGSARHTLLRTLPLLCAVAILWLATRHYFGVVKDAHFYMVEALRELDPPAFTRDMYFQFGSQGRFSLFSHLYVPFVSHFGVGAAGMGFAIAGQLCWVLALGYLARNWIGERFMWLSLAAVIVMPNIYAYFAYGERFATPRLFAEALTMLALAFLGSRPVWTFALLAFSAALHPLMTLPGVVAALAYFALVRPVLWLAFPAGAIAIAVLAWAGISPFAHLLQTVDPTWLSVIRLRSPQCLLTSLPASGWLPILAVFLWSGFALLLTKGRERRFLTAVLIAGSSGLVCTLIGADVAHNAFVMELQTWRSLWLIQVISTAYIPVVLFSLLAKRNPDAFPLSAVLAAGLILLSAVTGVIRQPFADFNAVSLLLVAGALAVILVELLLDADRYRHFRLASLCCAVVLVPTASLGWDMRTPWTKFVESPGTPPAELAALLPQKSLVYWEGGPEMLWLRLKRSNYFSCQQGTGVVFQRETAMTYRHRVDSFWPLRSYDLDPDSECSGFDKSQTIDRTPQRLQTICRREPGLDALVLAESIPGLRPKIWKSPALFQDVHLADGKPVVRATDRFYIYSCAGVR